MNKKTVKQTPKRGRGKSPSPALSSAVGSGAGGKTGIMKILSGLASALGLGRGGTGAPRARTGDDATRLARQRTDLAMERNYLAAERTLMGWIRTSLSMISFGFAIGKLGQVVENVEVKRLLGSPRMVSVERIAIFLVVLGTAALLGAALQHWRRVRELHAMGLPRQFSITFIVALLLAAVGAFALSSLAAAL